VLVKVGLLQAGIEGDTCVSSASGDASFNADTLAGIREVKMRIPTDAM